MLDVSLLIAVVLGITEAAKRAGMDSKWAPFLSIALGVAYTVAFGEKDLATNIMGGIMVGLSASGLYSGTMKQIRG